MKKKILLTFPLVGLLLSGCQFKLFGKTITIGDEPKAETENNQEQGGGEQGGGEEGNKEFENALAAFNSLVSDIKSKHNYTLYVHSQFDDEQDTSEILDGYYYNINNKAWFNTVGTYPLSGIVLQKDQGYLYFDSLGSSIIDDGFVSTNKDKGVSELWDLVGENLFYDEYTQDSEDPTKFVTKGTNNNNVATAANFTQYSPYIETSQFSVDPDGMTASLDATNKTITLTLKWKIWYYDEGEHQDPGTITITVKDVGETHNQMIEDFIENPSIVYEKPTSWPENSDSIFQERFGGVTPVFPNDVSYAFEFDDVLYSGFYYATVTDYACGDISSKYGAQLVADGYEKKSDTKYVKEVASGSSTMKTSYTVTFAYTAADEREQFPNGIMKIRYRSVSTTGVFSSITDFNQYLMDYHYNEIFPLLPEEDTCTGISNFKDNTASSADYALKFNGTDWINVAIPTYAKAVAFRNAFVQACKDKGFTDAQEGAGYFDSYSYESDSTYQSSIIICSFSEGSYNGVVQFRAFVSNEDAEEMRKPAGALDHISISGQTTTYSVGDSFSFDGTCTAYFTNGDSMVVQPTSVSTPFMNSAGEKQVTVSYTIDGVTKEASYTITVNAKVYPSINVTVNDYCVVDHIEDEGCNTITTYNSKLNSCFIIKVSVESGYTMTGASLAGDSGAEFYYIPEDEEIWVFPTKSDLSSYDVTLTFGTEAPEPETYKLTKTIGLTGGQIKMISPSTSGSSWDVEVGTTVSFWLSPYTGYEAVAPSVEGHPEFVFNQSEEDGHIVYSFAMPEYDVTLTASFNEKAATKTYSISTPTLVGGQIYNVNPGKSNIEAGTNVRFTVKADENYEFVENSIVVKDSNENIISCTLAPMSSTTYMFTMPESDVTITAEFASTISTHSVSRDSSEAYSIVFVSGVIGEGDIRDAQVGSEIKFSITIEEGYELDGEPFIVGHEEIEITKTVNWAGKAQYSFTMPDFDVTISANTQAIGGGEGEGGEGEGGEQDSSFTGGTYSYVVNEVTISLIFNEDKTGSYNYGSYKIDFTWSANATIVTIVPEEDYDESSFGSKCIFFGNDSIQATLADDYSTITVTMGNNFAKSDKTINRQ